MTSTELEIFQYNDQQVRTVMIDGETWFVAKDVCDILEIQNPSDTLKSLDDDERASFNLGHPSYATNVINEPGLYSLILRSRKPEAKAFKRWITHEVLPSIRKHGVYSVNVPSAAPAVQSDALKLLQYKTRSERKAERELEAKLEAKGLYRNSLTGEIIPLPAGATVVYALTPAVEAVIREQTKDTIRRLHREDDSPYR